MQIELDDQYVQRIQDACVSAAVSAVENETDRAITQSVDAAVRERIAAICDDTIKEVVGEILKSGFVKTDNYGCVQGTETLRDRVTAVMFPLNGYDSPITRIFRDELDKALEGELSDLLKQAREQLKALLQDDILGKLRGYLRDGLAFK